jgi:hypothetical protein
MPADQRRLLAICLGAVVGMRRLLALMLQRSAPLVYCDAQNERIARMRDLNCRCLCPQGGC